MSYYMGTQYTSLKSRSIESPRPYKENGVKTSGNFGLGTKKLDDAAEGARLAARGGLLDARLGERRQDIQLVERHGLWGPPR